MRAVLVAFSLLAVGCGSSVVRQAPGKPPTPTTISVAEPGGDAHDAHEAALLRQLHEPWGRRNDKDDQIHVPTPDWEHWKRVRYFGIEHFAGWRYGDEHHVAALAVLIDLPSEGQVPDADACIRRFDAWARPQAADAGAKIDRMGVITGKRWKGRAIAVEWADGHLDTAFMRREYSAAWAAYGAYPDTCLVYGVGVPWREHAELARQVRDRYVDEGFERMITLTPAKPERK